jgi:hypothetical protein
MRREISVVIYERVKYGEGWRRQRVVTPPLRANGTLYLKDEIPFLSDAIAQAREKSWFLSNRHQDVSDPTEKDSTRKKLSIEAIR